MIVGILLIITSIVLSIEGKKKFREGYEEYRETHPRKTKKVITARTVNDDED